MNANRTDALEDGAFVLPAQYQKHLTMKIKGLRHCLGFFFFFPISDTLIISFCIHIKPKAGSEAPLFMSFFSCPCHYFFQYFLP